MECTEILNVVRLEVAVGCKVKHLNNCKGIQDGVRASPDMSIHIYSAYLVILSEEGKTDDKNRKANWNWNPL
jgi:hypothetical protein